MATTAADRPRLWPLVLRELWRRARLRMRVGPLFRWRFSGRSPERVLVAPPDLRLADGHIAADIYAGRFALAGHVVEAGGESPFRLDVSNRAWTEALHGFRWLRHMREAGTDLANANARALVTDWIAIHGGRICEPAWNPSTTAIRVIAWLQHSTVVLQGCELPFYRTYLRSLSAQIRYLRAMVPDMPAGEDRLRARIAIALASLSLPQSPASVRQAARRLDAELKDQILPDGGHVSRSPLALLELLADLLPLRQTYASQGETPPPELIPAVERMLPMLRFFRHQDGNLARFNGAGATSPDRIMAILQHDESQGAPLTNATHSGFNRLQLGNTTVIVDTGAAPPADVAGRAHAGCLSFEMSSGRHHFIVNCGVDNYGPPEYLALSRATAAHSTATLNDTSSARFATSGWTSGIIGAPLVQGPRKTPCERSDGEGHRAFTASHDGYAARFGIIHERNLVLRENGHILDGTDRFHRPNGEPPTAKNDAVALRFHIHPDIGVWQDEHGQVILAAPAGDNWIFTTGGARPTVEDSIFFAGIAGPERTRQIVLFFNASELPEVRWRFTRISALGNDGA